MTKFVVVPPGWNTIGEVEVAVSFGLQVITVCGLFTATFVVVPLGVVIVADPATSGLPVPRKLCAAAGLGPTASAVAKARIEQAVRLRRLSWVRMITSRATVGS